MKTNEAVLREALENVLAVQVLGRDSSSYKGVIQAGYTALAATATVAKDGGEPIDYAGDFVKLAIDEAEKRGLDYVSTRILRALLAKYATPKPEASADAQLWNALSLMYDTFHKPIGMYANEARVCELAKKALEHKPEASAEQPAGYLYRVEQSNGTMSEWRNAPRYEWHSWMTAKSYECKPFWFTTLAAPISEDAGAAASRNAGVVDNRRCKKCASIRGGDTCWKCGSETFTPDPRCGDEPALPPIDRIRKLAKEVGYAIGVHGSQQRDFDVIAAPWTDMAIGNHALLEHIAAGLKTDNGPARIISTERKPLGRYAATIQMDGWYKQLDISVCPNEQYERLATTAPDTSAPADSGSAAPIHEHSWKYYYSSAVGPMGGSAYRCECGATSNTDAPTVPGDPT